ncbi:MAG: hypothetical protein ACI3WQ_02840 [Faecousia sp.]
MITKVFTECSRELQRQFHKEEQEESICFFFGERGKPLGWL